MRRVVIVAGVFLVLTTSVVFGCARLGGNDDPALDELRHDPLAARAQPGARLTIADDVAASRGGLIFHKPRETQVLRAFTPTAGSLESLSAELVSLARTSNWDVHPAPGGSSGSKTFSFGQATLSITVNPYTSPATVVVVMTKAAG